jgi:hypothetical protein
MRFLYLIQGKSSNVTNFRFLRSDNTELIGLTYDTPLEGFIFFPRSTFATGRNLLYTTAIDYLQEFDYFIFLDDDVGFSRGSFKQMEGNLATFRPALAVPLTEKTRLSALGIERKGVIHPLINRQLLHINDEQYLAMSRSVLEDGYLLPYMTLWDEKSWFVCCLIQEALIQHYYFGKAYQFNDCEISNNQHSGAYPHNLEFAQSEYRQWMREHFPSGTKRPAIYQCTVQLDGSLPSIARSLYSVCSSLVRKSRTYRHFRGIQKW